MRFFSAIAATLASASVVSAGISGFTMPTHIVAGETFTLSLNQENVTGFGLDVAVAWGYSQAPGFPGTLGRFYNSTGLGYDMSNKGYGSVDIEVLAPPKDQVDFVFKDDDTILFALGVYTIYGASGSYKLTVYNTTINFADEISNDTITTTIGVNAAGFSYCDSNSTSST